MNIKIEKITQHDLDKFIELIILFEKVFEMKNFNLPERKYLQEIIKNPNFIVFVASVDNIVIGGLTAYVLDQYYSTKPLVYIYDLAVKTEYQRQGFGKLLLSNLKNYSSEKGYEEVFVQADKIDAHAIDFYRSTKGREEQVIHFTYTL